jgi:hypothetical protein
MNKYYADYLRPNEHVVFLQTRGTLLCGVKWKSCVFDSSGTTDERVDIPQPRC